MGPSIFVQWKLSGLQVLDKPATNSACVLLAATSYFRCKHKSLSPGAVDLRVKKKVYRAQYVCNASPEDNIDRLVLAL